MGVDCMDFFENMEMPFASMTDMPGEAALVMSGNFCCPNVLVQAYRILVIC